MADVAKVAGVSTTTVSHVLNGTRKVAPETEAVVRDALASTGYRHNLAARALATQSTDTIGLAMSFVTNPYFAELVRDIELKLRAAGYTMILADTNEIGRASCREKSVDLGGRRSIEKKKKNTSVARDKTSSYT